MATMVNFLKMDDNMEWWLFVNLLCVYIFVHVHTQINAVKIRTVSIEEKADSCAIFVGNLFPIV